MVQYDTVYGSQNFRSFQISLLDGKYFHYLNFSKSQAVGSVMINNCTRCEVMERALDLEYGLLFPN